MSQIHTRTHKFRTQYPVSRYLVTHILSYDNLVISLLYTSFHDKYESFNRLIVLCILGKYYQNETKGSNVLICITIQFSIRDIIN